MYSRISILLDDREVKALESMAQDDCRPPKDQMRYLVREAAQRRGMTVDHAEQKKVAQRPDKQTTDDPGSA